jgi:hypothetical protein
LKPPGVVVVPSNDSTQPLALSVLPEHGRQLPVSDDEKVPAGHAWSIERASKTIELSEPAVVATKVMVNGAEATAGVNVTLEKVHATAETGMVATCAPL